MEVNSYVQNPDGTTQVIVQKKRVSLKLSVVIIIAMVLSVLAGAAGILILLKVNPNFARNSVTNAAYDPPNNKEFAADRRSD